MRHYSKPRLRRRDGFFLQLDRLHDPDEWFEGNKPIDLESYQSFVRAYLGRYVEGKPALALTPKGHLTAIWQHSDARLYIEFLPDNMARFLITQPIEQGIERLAGDTSTARLRQVLEALQGPNWFHAS